MEEDVEDQAWDGEDVEDVATGRQAPASGRQAPASGHFQIAFHLYFLKAQGPRPLHPQAAAGAPRPSSSNQGYQRQVCRKCQTKKKKIQGVL